MDVNKMLDNLLGISIHAPREGSDFPLIYDALPHAEISIHAPREGSDAGTPPSWSAY